MRKFLLASVMLSFLYFAMAQSPQLMNYQAIVRNAQGQPVANTTVNFQFQIHQGTSLGSVAFTETDTALTNQFGLAAVKIGSTSNLASVSWGTGNQYLQVGVDETGGVNFVDMGTSQLLSVPYALYAGSAVGATGPAGTTGNNGTNGVTGATGAQGNTGAPGATGQDGINGTNGVTGATGANGLNGNTGATGQNGTNGTNGATGQNGTNGVTGATGQDGTNGAAGATGATGPSGGPVGPTGAQGVTGPDGANGTNGGVGATGAQGNQLTDRSAIGGSRIKDVINCPH